MKNYKFKFFIFVASLIIGFFIITNLGVGKSFKLFNMNTIQYKDAAIERNNLYEVISDLKDENYELSKKIYNYTLLDDSDEKIIEDMKRQVGDYGIISGNAEVYGPGIEITISDGEYDIINGTQFEIDRKTLHDNDVAQLLNELRLIGAEAIAINSYRIVNDTGVTCGWVFITFDDTTIEAEPFKFYAIGDPEQLEAGILSEGSHLNELIIRGLNVKIEKKDKITLNKTTKTLSPIFMEINTPKN